ncbi:MAG TPA: lanthionine synthetase LanC family protein [Bryobacteraceae bacterium]|nr:lanthionine synthetase LanC family protein [Bryobacteraceae bacterium]
MVLVETRVLEWRQPFWWSGRSRDCYERSTFMPASDNWPDYRIWPARNSSTPQCELAWCHGAPGIALARIDSLQYIDDFETREEIRIALRSTAQSKFGFNHCLCHGDLGNLDILCHAARRMQAVSNAAVDELKGRVLTTLCNIGCLCGWSALLPAPGLMVGLAGVGYGLLRLASWQRLPSVLILEPPAL